MKRAFTYLFLLMSLAVLVTACAEGLIESAVEQSTGADIDLDDDQISVEIDGATLEMGSGVDAPDWLPSDFPIVSPLDIELSVGEPESQRWALYGSTDADHSETASRTIAWFESNGFEVFRNEVDDDGAWLSARAPDGQVFDIVQRDGNYALDLSYRDAQFDIDQDEQAAAEIVESSGTAEFVSGGFQITMDGTCIIQGTSYQFDGTTESGDVITLSMLEDTGSAYVGSFGDPFISLILSWFTLDEPTLHVTTGPSEFSVQGNFSDGTTAELTDSTLAVKCAN